MAPGRLRPHAKLVGFGLVTAIFAGAIATLDPLLMKYLIDTTLPHRRLSDSLLIVMSLALCFVGRSALNGGSGLVSFRVAQLLAGSSRGDHRTYDTLVRRVA